MANELMGREPMNSEMMGKARLALVSMYKYAYRHGIDAAMEQAEHDLDCLSRIMTQERTPAAPHDPSPTPWDFSTWGFYCDSCATFFDLLNDGRVEVSENGSAYRHKCGNIGRYISYDRTAKPQSEAPGVIEEMMEADWVARNCSTAWGAVTKDTKDYLAKGMTAAYHVAATHFEREHERKLQEQRERDLREPTDAEIDQYGAVVYSQYGVPAVTAKVVAHRVMTLLLNNRRTPQKADPAVEAMEELNKQRVWELGPNEIKDIVATLRQADAARKEAQ